MEQEQIAEALSQVPKSESAAGPSRRVVLFLSFDLVNSTRYKAQSRDWPSRIASFYTKVVDNATGQTDHDFEVWKFAGDEVILRCDIKSESQVAKIVRWAAEFLVELVRTLRADTCCQLSAKGTVWLAEVVNAQEDSMAVEYERYGDSNICIHPHSTRAEDFLGREIDIGFRIGQFAQSGLLCLSVEVALLLPGDENIRLAGHESLKGVWEGAPYPILLYSNDWGSLRSLIPYHEEVSSRRLADLLAGVRESTPLHQHLLRVIGDVNVTRRWDLLNKTLKGAQTAANSVAAVPRAPKAEDEQECEVRDG